jgi:hypothetical protein
VGFRTKSDVRNHQAIIQPRFSQGGRGRRGGWRGLNRVVMLVASSGP